MGRLADKGINLREAAEALGVGRVVLYGILIGMGITATSGRRTDGGTKPKLLTTEQIRMIREHLAAYRRVK